MIRSLSRSQAAGLGLVVVLGLALGGLGLFAVGNRHGLRGDALALRCGVPSAQGVEPGTRVRVQGVEAGEVREVAAPQSPGDSVVLHLKVRGSFRPLIRADATVRIVSEGLVGGKVVEITPGRPESPAAANRAMLAFRPTAELGDVLDEVRTTLRDVRDGQGPLGKELLAAVQDARGTLQSVGKTSDTVRRLPGVSYFDKDAEALLVRPRCDQAATVIPEGELFEPGKAALTAEGKRRLDELAPRLRGTLAYEGADLVVVASADSKAGRTASEARKITADQSAAVCDYLKQQHAIQKAGWITWRQVTPLGLGLSPYPGEEAPQAPPPWVAVVVFVPRK